MPSINFPNSPILNEEFTDAGTVWKWNGSAWLKLGAIGPQGVQGTDGAFVAQGIQGLQGIQGIQGIQGLQGIQGTQGLQGIQGLQGLQGTQGIQGTQGRQGIQGLDGLFAGQGTQGITGIQGLGAVSAATQITSSTTLTNASSNKYIPVNSSSAINITINPNVFVANDQIVLEQTGTGQVTVVAGSGMTLTGGLKTMAQYYIVVIFFKSATSANVIGGTV